MLESILNSVIPLRHRLLARLINLVFTFLLFSLERCSRLLVASKSLVLDELMLKKQVMIIDYKLTYPSGTATAVLINGFHTSKGDKTANFFWAFFGWFYSGGDACGFSQFPTFGLQAWKKSFFFDFSMTYVGAGMICSHLVNLLLLFGAILSWGIMWPLIARLKGEWFPATLPESSMKSLNGYKVFICIALILGDGLYNFLKILLFTGRSFHSRLSKTNTCCCVGGAVVPKQLSWRGKPQSPAFPLMRPCLINSGGRLMKTDLQQGNRDDGDGEGR